jgi:hypothetical protein
MSDQPAMRADSQPPQNAASTPPVPDKPQWAREFEECWKACREQLEARVVAAGRVA